MEVAVRVFGVGGEVVEVFVEEGDGAVGCCVGADFGAIGGRCGLVWVEGKGGGEGQGRVHRW